MNNYIVINGQRIELTEDQVKLITANEESNKVKLSAIPVADTVRIGNHEMVVLEQLDGATALIRKDLYGEAMEFCSNNNYVDSYVDCSCETFACEIAEAIGADNIIDHTVDLTSDDGLKDYGVIERRASLLTTDRYRKYVETLDRFNPDAWWWLATPYSTATHGNDVWVKCVSPSGSIYDGRFNLVNGVRPFCILKSDIFVSR